jgi:nucleotide-binding universal stress UspA family protein
MKVILVPVADRPECRSALERAFELAEICGGSVVGCHLRPPRGRDGQPERGGRFRGLRKWNAVAEGLSAQQVEARSEAAEALFKGHAAASRFELVDQPALNAQRTARWAPMIGTLERLFATIGPISDVSVVSRPEASSAGPGADFMLAALVETGKPVIVLPQQPAESLGRRVLIAWNQSIEAARAVAAALPVLQRAESVQIVSAGPGSQSRASGAAVVDYLRYWGVTAVCRRTKGRDAAVEILDFFRNEGSDLLVMGAYSHGRVRELVFGGVTQDLLFDAPLPVLALHS